MSKIISQTVRQERTVRAEIQTLERLVPRYSRKPGGLTVNLIESTAAHGWSVMLGVDLQLVCDSTSSGYDIEAVDANATCLQVVAKTTDYPPTDAIIAAARATAIQLFPDHVTMTTGERMVQRARPEDLTPDQRKRLDEGGSVTVDDLNDAQRALLGDEAGRPIVLDMPTATAPSRPLAPHRFLRDRPNWTCKVHGCGRDGHDPIHTVPKGK